jgi:flagellar M-ring protein FliF
MNKQLVQLGKQLVGIWQQLGVSQRISIVLAALVVTGALVSLAFWSSRVDYALLYGKLDDAEAAKVVAVLDEMKIPNKVGQGGGAIYVARDKVYTARMQLASKGLPRGDGGVGFEIFDKATFGISDFQQRANYIRAVQGELARTISQLDEIESARVMIVAPENRLLVEANKRATASVFVRTKGQGQLSASAVNSIRFLVANSVEGLQANQVVVVDNRGNELSENNEPDSIAGLTATQLSARRSYEQYLAKKAQEMLEVALGPGQAVVRVSADINFDQVTRTEEKFDPEGQVVRTSTINDESTDTTASGGATGAPGVASNLGFDTNSAALASGNSTKTKKKLSTSQFEIGKVTTSMTQLAGGLKRVSAAVFIASRFEGTGAERKAVPRSKEVLETLRRSVQNALGAQTNTEGAPKDEITLEEIPFADGVGDVAQEAMKVDKKQFWWNQVQNYMYPVLGLVVLVIFWRALKKTPVESIPAGSAGESAAGSMTMAPAVRRGMTPMVSPEVFNQLVREHPDNINQAIQQWLNRSNGSPLSRQ